MISAEPSQMAVARTDELPAGAFFLGKPYLPQMLGDVLQVIRQQLP